MSTPSTPRRTKSRKTRYKPILIPLLICPLIVLVGVVLIVCGVNTRKSQEAFLRTAVRNDAVIVDFREYHRAKSADTYAPIFEFTPPGGTNIRLTSSISTSAPTEKIGDRLAVLYPPGEPQKAELESAARATWPATLLRTMGIGFIALGVVVGCALVYAFRFFDLNG